MEKNEWRLAYNPLGRIRRLGYAAAYYDRLIDTDQYQYEKNRFIQSKYKFIVKKGSLSSYVELNFENIRNGLIQEIVIGVKSQLNSDDKDLQLFLTIHGYEISKLPIEGKLIVSKSDNPLQ